MSCPTILLVAGSFGLPELYDGVVRGAASKGIEVVVPRLPSVGLKTGPREGELPTMYDDAALIAREIGRLADSGKDVVVVSHSYGGVPATESVKGLTKDQRRQEGKKGGVVRLAYMTALVAAVGMPAMAVLHDVPVENRVEMDADENGWLYHTDIRAAAAVVFSNLPRDEGEAWMRRFPTHSYASFTGELTHAGYREVPVSYLICEGDMLISAIAAREAIELIERESGNKVDVMTIKADHCPTASAPQDVVDWFVHIVG